MALKTYSIRLEEREYEKLRDFIGKHGDPDLNINYLVRSYIADLNRALPDLEKSEFSVKNQLAYWGMMLRQIMRTTQMEHMLKGDDLPEKEKVRSS
jgi:hypothetical protein